MWFGGVRVVIEKDQKILMLKQNHKEREFWLVPGGGIEKGENSKEAAVREVKEETGLNVTIKDLIWHIEEVSEDPKRGQRFVNYFLAEIIGGKLALGLDPEFDQENQVLADIKFMDKNEIKKLAEEDKIFPASLKDEIWDILEGKPHEVFRQLNRK